jgi:hypothetical protein
MKNIKKTVIVAVLLSALTIGSASALSFTTGAGGEYLGWGLIGAPTSVFAQGGGGYAFAEIDWVGLEVGYEYAYAPWVLIGALYAGAYGKYPFEIAPGFSLFPKLGVNAVINFGTGPLFGLDIDAGVGVDYDFTRLLGLGLIVRAEVLFDALITFPDNFYNKTLVGLGPRIRVAAGYRF